MIKKKILYIINHMDWFWSHRFELAAGAQAAGWDVVIAAPGAVRDIRLAQHGFTGRDLPEGRGILTVLKTIREISRLIAREKPVFVHAITLKCAFMTGIAARFHSHVKTVHTIAGLGYLFSAEGLKPKLLRRIAAPLLKWSLKNPRAQIIFQNPDDQGLMTAARFVRAQQCHLIKGSGVDTQKFAYAPKTQDGDPLVLMPTRLVREKGVEVFIQAARILKDKGIPARFQIAGELSKSNPHALTKEDMAALTEDGTVQWLGRVDDMPGLLSRCALVVYPSWYGEGVPKVLLEAAAAGRAIVTTDHVGCREVVQHGRNGLLVPVKDPQATALAIERLLGDSQERLRMGFEGRRRAENEFDVRIIVRETLNLYKSGFSL